MRILNEYTYLQLQCSIKLGQYLAQALYILVMRYSRCRPLMESCLALHSRLTLIKRMLFETSAGINLFRLIHKLNIKFAM